MINARKFCNQYNVCRWCITSNESEWVSWTSWNPQHHYQFSRYLGPQQQRARFLKNWSSTETARITSLTPHVSQGFYDLWCLQLFSNNSSFTGRWLDMTCQDAMVPNISINDSWFDVDKGWLKLKSTITVVVASFGCIDRNSQFSKQIRRLKNHLRFTKLVVFYGGFHHHSPSVGMYTNLTYI